MRAPEPLYEIDVSLSPPSCLPTGLDRSNLVDITALTDSWRRYMNTTSGRVHDGAEYYKQLRDLEERQ